ncbi:MAG TPA: cation:proton antiporter [Steroidobacteraceae bacterium]|nr:cation:proton antiporter [Steroidobacteraceae bacterium]
MPVESLGQVLILLTVSVLLVSAGSRIGLPPLLGYLIVGILLGPFAFAVLPNGSQTRAIADIGVVFLLFTLGLEFSFPRMVAMRREVFGLGSAQTLIVGGAGAVAAHALGISWPSATVIGGALSMCSTAIVLKQLGDQDEINRTHGRLSFAVLLFQDLAFVPLLALAGVLAAGQSAFTAASVWRLVGLGLFALAAVLAIGRWVLRPLLYLIAHSRLREVFTLAALLVVLTSAWITQRLGLSMALGAFLAGMMFAETEYRHQIEAVIRPFRELLLGLFFISVGMLLDLRLLQARFLSIFGLLAIMVAAKTLLSALTTRAFVPNGFKALRTGLVLAGGGEFGVALLTLLARDRDLLPARAAQLLLATVVLGMIVSPLIIRYNRRIARWLLRETAPPRTAVQREDLAAIELARREHVIMCGFGRVGRNLARVLESQGFEYLAMDLDPVNVRAAREAGEPVFWGDSADEELLRNLGVDVATVIIITFADPAVAIGVVRAVRRLRSDVPVLVRTQDDSRLADLSQAGATEIVPETFEASLTLVSQALTLLQLPTAQVARVVDTLRAQRYATLRTQPTAARPEQDIEPAELLRSVVLPPQAWAVGRQLEEVRAHGAEVSFTAIRRQGITGREPAWDTQLREGDVVVIYGLPTALEHAEAVLLTG